MAKILLTDWDASGRPVTSETWLHIQESYKEQFNAVCTQIVQNMFGAIYVANVYILYGCVLDSSGVNHVISEGAVFCGGEVFMSPLQSIPKVPGTVVVADLGVTYYSGVNPDPIEYKDTSLHSPHQTRAVLFKTGASGSGTFSQGGPSSVNDLSNFITLNNRATLTYTAAALDGLTVTFDANNTYVRDVSANPTNTITLDFTGAQVGNTVTIFGLISATNTIIISTSGSNFANGPSLTAPSSASYVFMKITYLGTAGGNDLTTTEITYDV